MTDNSTEKKPSPLELARIAMQKRRDSGEEVIIEHLTPTEKAKRNPRSRKFAINAKCYECQGFSCDPAVRWRIGNCSLDDCALFPVRPYQKMIGRPMPAGLAKALSITIDDGIEVSVSNVDGEDNYGDDE